MTTIAGSRNKFINSPSFFPRHHRPRTAVGSTRFVITGPRIKSGGDPVRHHRARPGDQGHLAMPATLLMAADVREPTQRTNYVSPQAGTNPLLPQGQLCAHDGRSRPTCRHSNADARPGVAVAVQKPAAGWKRTSTVGWGQGNQGSGRSRKQMVLDTVGLTVVTRAVPSAIVRARCWPMLTDSCRRRS
jgi:hypothetical protein